jgi:RNA polymerase sigma-70 factor (ECF subfamily)
MESRGRATEQSKTQAEAEELLVSQIARADADAFAVLYDRYGGPVYSLAVGILRDPHVAQDVTQDVFLGIWRGAAEFDARRGTARAWIFALAHHKTVDAVRRQQRSAMEPLSESIVHGRDVVAEVIQRIESRRLRDALMVLSVEQRAAIVLAYYGGYTQQEIAERVGAPLGTVKTRMRDGLHRLRSTLGRTEETAR